MFENLKEEPYEKIIDQLPVDQKPSQIVTRENEVECKFTFDQPFGSEKLIFSATCNMSLKKFYFEVENSLSGEQIPLLNKREFAEEVEKLSEGTQFSLR
jgi:hypothetical protein